MHPGITFDSCRTCTCTCISANLVAGPGTSTQKYLTDIIDGQIARLLTGKLRELNLRSCFVHRALVHHVFPDETALFAVSHGNLAAHKIIIDHDYNITGYYLWPSGINQILIVSTDNGLELLIGRWHGPAHCEWPCGFLRFYLQAQTSQIRRHLQLLRLAFWWTGSLLCRTCLPLSPSKPLKRRFHLHRS